MNIKGDTPSVGEDTKVVQPKIRESLPSYVDTDLHIAVSGLRRMEEVIEAGRRTDEMFHGNGRYEADAIRNYYGTPAGLGAMAGEYRRRIYRYRMICPPDINFDELLKEYGEYNELVWVSRDARDFFRDEEQVSVLGGEA